MKKVTSKQNIAIIVLSILLLVSIGFGATYSYFNGRSGTLSTGSLTMATLEVSLRYEGDDQEESSKFSLHEGGNRVVPGQDLHNTALQIENNSPVSTYMAVVYSLSIEEQNPDIPKIDPTKLEAMDIKASSVGEGWRRVFHICSDGQTVVSMLIYLGSKFGTTEVEKGYGDGIFPVATNPATSRTTVIGTNSLKVPESWGNEMQGATITLTFTAYVIQSTAVANTYESITHKGEIDPATGLEFEADVNIRAENIASMFITQFDLDPTKQPTQTPEQEPEQEPSNPITPAE